MYCGHDEVLEIRLELGLHGISLQSSVLAASFGSLQKPILANTLSLLADIKVWVCGWR